MVFISGLFFLFVFAFSVYSQVRPILRISSEDYSNFSRFHITSSQPFPFDIERTSSSFLVKIKSDGSFRIRRENNNSDFIKSFSWAKKGSYIELTIKLITDSFSYDYFTLNEPFQIIIDFSKIKERKIENEEPLSGEPSDNDSLNKTEERIKEYHSSSSIPNKDARTSRRGSSFNPKSGRKIIVVDPGHGGMWSGAVGKFGTLEKDITLAIALKLKSIIERNLAFQVILTREKDVNVSLEKRASEANYYNSVVFISIHANASHRKSARGPETFFLSLNATDEEARKLAYMENRSSVLKESIESKDEDEIEMILWDMAQTAFIQYSSQLAEYIQNELNSLQNTLNRGIKQAPFKVLSGVACPAVLVEVAFLTNPREEKKLLTKEFQNDVAMGIFRGLRVFLRDYLNE